MKNHFTFLLSITFSLLTLNNFAQQNKCATTNVLNKAIEQDPSVLERYIGAETELQAWKNAHPGNFKTRAITTIPVVVHVVYKNSVNNISQAQIESQIERLNLDFRLFNSDSLTPDHPYWVTTADTQIEFCLADTDPNGNPTSGITRTLSDSANFTMGYHYMKSDATGGKTGWPSEKYLNLWVTKLDGSWLGFATFPSDLASAPAIDGVVIRPEAFGSVGTAGSGVFTGNDMGRTATHEVGHWLFLRHVWGDNTPDCGDDLVDDTKGAYEPNFGIPTFPLKPNNGCGSGQYGEMFMNYMDYPDDAALVMFTYGQAGRMNAALGLYRFELLTSNGCSGMADISEKNKTLNFSIFPNPTSSKIQIQFFVDKVSDVIITNLIGEKVMFLKDLSNINNTIDLSKLNDGVYFINTSDGLNKNAKKIVLIK